jgi:Zn-dependent alcohol dehydrogenase
VENSSSAEKEKWRPARTGSSTTLAAAESTAPNQKHILVHENGLVKIENGMPFYKAAALPCGNMTGAGGTIPPTPVVTVLEDIPD